MAEIDVHLPEDAIRLRSYFIWQREGCPEGQALSHWLRAKAELEAELQAGPLPRMSFPFVMPRFPISVPPNRSISVKIGREAA